MAWVTVFPLPRHHCISFLSSAVFLALGAGCGCWGLRRPVVCVTYTSEEMAFPERQCGRHSHLPESWCMRRMHERKLWESCAFVALVLDCLLMILLSMGTITILDLRCSWEVHPTPVSVPHSGIRGTWVDPMTWPRGAKKFGAVALRRYLSGEQSKDVRDTSIASLWGISKVFKLVMFLEYVREEATMLRQYPSVFVRCSDSGAGNTSCTSGDVCDKLPTSDPGQFWFVLFGVVFFFLACGTALPTRMSFEYVECSATPYLEGNDGCPRRNPNAIQDINSTFQQVCNLAYHGSEGNRHFFKRVPAVQQLMRHPKAKYKHAALVLNFLAILLAWDSYCESWVCVRGITADKVLVGGLQSQLLLMGKCGRPDGVGPLSLYSSWLLGIMFFIQVLLFSCPLQLENDDNLAILVHVLHSGTQQLIREASGDFMQGADHYIWCHVWVRSSAPQQQQCATAWLDFATCMRWLVYFNAPQLSCPLLDEGESICDCSVPAAGAARHKWKRSKEPVQAKLIWREAEEWHNWREGLYRGSREPCVCIEVGTPPRPQVIPHEFVVGRMSMELGLGAKRAYERVYLTLLGVVLSLILWDIQMFVRFPRLTACQEFMMEGCVEVLVEGLTFQYSVGVFWAGLAWLLTLCALPCAVKGR